MEELLPLEIVEEMKLKGPAATFEELHNQTDQEIAKELSSQFERQGIAVPGARNYSDMISYLRGLVSRLRGRKLIQDLGIHESRIKWLECHIPPGGEAHLKLEQGQKSEKGVNLKLMGLGFGSGLEFKLTTEYDFGKRSRCFHIGNIVDVQMKEYQEKGGQRTIQVDVLRSIGTYLDDKFKCNKCFSSPEEGPLLRKLDRVWDLSGSLNGLTETITYDLSKDIEIELGLHNPILNKSGISAGIAVKRSIGSKCEATYIFSGNARYSAFSDIMSDLGLSYWGKY